jgi:hypothetical protein
VLSYEAIETPLSGAEAEEEKREPSAMPEPGGSLPESAGTADRPGTDEVESGSASQSYEPDRAVTPEPLVQFPGHMEAAAAAVTGHPGITGESSDSPTFAGSAKGPAASRRSSGGDRRNESTAPLDNNAVAARQVAEAAMDSINSAATEALAQLKAGQLRVEAHLAPQTEAYQNLLAEISTATKELDRRSESLLEEFQRKLEAVLQDFQAKSVAQAEELRKTSENLLERAVSQLREQSESTFRDTEAARNSIHASGEQARARLESAKGEMESRNAAFAEAHDKRMAELSSAMERLEHRAGVLLCDFEKSLGETLQDFRERGARERAELDRATQVLLENSKKKLQAHADATDAGLGEKASETLAMTAEEGRKQVASTQQTLESLAQVGSERFGQRLAQKSKEQSEIASHTTEAAVNTIRLTAERAVNRLEAAEEKIEEGFSTWADVFQSRLGELFAGMEGLERHSEALLRDFRRQLEIALQEFVERKAAETGSLEEASQDVAERLTLQVDERAEATLEKLREEARAIVMSVEVESQTHLANANKALESATRAAAELYVHRLARTSAAQNEQAWLAADEVVNSISLTAEESVARVEAAQERMEARFAALIETHEKRTAEISSSFEELEKRCATVLEEMRRRFQDPTPVGQQEDPPESPKKNAAGAN